MGHDASPTLLAHRWALRDGRFLGPGIGAVWVRVSHGGSPNHGEFNTKTGWWFGTFGLFSISYMGCHPSHWRTPSFFKMVFLTTNQKMNGNFGWCWGSPILRKPPVHFIWGSCENLAHPLPDLVWPLEEPGSCRRKKPKHRWLQPSKKAAEPGNLPCRGQPRWVTLTFWRFMLDPKPQDRVVSDDLWGS